MFEQFKEICYLSSRCKPQLSDYRAMTKLIIMIHMLLLCQKKMFEIYVNVFLQMILITNQFNVEMIMVQLPDSFQFIHLLRTVSELFWTLSGSLSGKNIVYEKNFLICLFLSVQYLKRNTEYQCTTCIIILHPLSYLMFPLLLCHRNHS